MRNSTSAMLNMARFVLFALFWVSAFGHNYEGYKVFRVVPKTTEQVEFVKILENRGVDFWKSCSSPGKSCDILLSPEQQTDVLAKFQLAGLDYHAFINDVQSLVEESSTRSSFKRARQSRSKRLGWDDYYSLEDIYAFLDEMADAHPTIASVIPIGSSVENRTLNVLKIAKSTTDKGIIFVEANAHAREWITNAVATYLINDLLNSEDPEVQQWTEDFDWYILPVFNPDGYEYTRNTNRLWRKNRATFTGTTCMGTDLNRNFDYNWCGVGASRDPCSDVHCGRATASENETVALTTFVRTLQPRLSFYLSVHSYSQFIMFPYADRADDTITENYMPLVTEAAKAAKVRYNTTFLPGSWTEILYQSTGDSMDWAKSKLNVPLSLTYELRDEGTYGFLLPPRFIIPSGEEFVDSLKPIVTRLKAGFP